jgi:hypothetical protein
MAEVKIKTAEQATQIAVAFVKRYYNFVFPIETKKENHVWIVDLDISVFRPKIARVKINSVTGAVDNFSVRDTRL